MPSATKKEIAKQRKELKALLAEIDLELVDFGMGVRAKKFSTGELVSFDAVTWGHIEDYISELVHRRARPTHCEFCTCGEQDLLI